MTMTHEAFVIPGSTKQSAAGGVEFAVRCCGVYEKSVHIQQAGKFTLQELLRVRQQHLDEIAKEHANEVAAHAFLAQDETSAKGTCECE